MEPSLLNHQAHSTILCCCRRNRWAPQV